MELEGFANQYQTKGEKMVAAGRNSMMNDKFHGQWLVLHRPFRHLEDFKRRAQHSSRRPPAAVPQLRLGLPHRPRLLAR